MSATGALRNTPGAPKNPREVAERIVNAIPENPVIDKLEVTGPGFIGIRLTKKFVSEHLAKRVSEGLLPIKVKRQRVVVDLSSPNIAKEMHVGHLRSTIIGESLSRILEFVNHDVVRVNHIGDWGTQFGMLIANLKDQFPTFATESPPISDLQKFYQDAKKRFDNDEEFKARAYQEVVKLQSGEDPEVTVAWKLICDVSRREFTKIYERLSVTATEKGESFYQSRMVKVVEDLEKCGLLEDEEGGRKIAWSSIPDAPPLMVVKSDGGYTYDTSDLATIRYRLDEEKAEQILYVVDNGQSLHFQLVFDLARKAGWWDPKKCRVEHVGFGVVLGDNRKKFSSRGGLGVRLKDLLDEGVERAKATFEEKRKAREERGAAPTELTEEERNKLYEDIAYSCIKYADLSKVRTNDYVFSYDKMLEDKGNTAVYLMYALMRIKAIFRNPELESFDMDAARKNPEFKLDHPKERQLAAVLLRFGEVLDKVLELLFPSLICDYMYELATAFTEFYDNCYCIETDKSGNKTIHASRLLLCDASARTLETCFGLVGLSVIERM